MAVEVIYETDSQPAPDLSVDIAGRIVVEPFGVITLWNRQWLDGRTGRAPEGRDATQDRVKGKGKAPCVENGRKPQ
jgi:hypothetical protein